MIALDGDVRKLIKDAIRQCEHAIKELKLLLDDEPEVKPKKILAVRYSSADMSNARHLLQLVQTNLPFVKTPTPAIMRTWYDSMYMLREVDGYDHKTIVAVIEWACNDSFWRKNIRSAPKLREKFETLLAHAINENKSMI